jgi:hypothetical protein
MKRSRETLDTWLQPKSKSQKVQVAESVTATAFQNGGDRVEVEVTPQKVKVVATKSAPVVKSFTRNEAAMVVPPRPPIVGNFSDYIDTDVDNLPLHQRDKSKGGIRVNLHRGKGVGKVVYTDEYGEWRTVPGFHPTHLIVSSMGWTRSRVSGGGGWVNPSPGYRHPSFYFLNGVNGYNYPVIQLVLRAFVGPGPKGQTGDHIAKYDGDKERERGDNRVENVRWATRALQSTNQGVRKAKRNGQPILVRDPSWPDGRWDRYPSATAANEALGVQGLGAVANGKRNSNGKYIAKRAPPDETQDDLPVETIPNNKGELIAQPAEVWRPARYSGGKSIRSARVSNRGRAQVKHARGTGWGYKFTPMPNDGEVYAIIGSKLFHVSVFFTFGGKLREGETVDHDDRDKTNNTFANLKAESKRGQILNQTRKPISERHNSQKMNIEARSRDDPYTPWRWFKSQSDAACVLGVHRGSISSHLKGDPEHTHVGGYVFRRCAAAYAGSSTA